MEENRKGVEIEWELPASKRGIKKFINNPEAYHNTPAEALEFHKEKETEVRNFIASGWF